MSVVAGVKITSCVLAFCSLVFAARDARADDTLHEGYSANVAVRSDQNVLAHAQADLTIFPFPAGPDVWDGPINSTRAEVTVRESLNPIGHTDVEHARVELIRWPHVHVLGVERDLRMGTEVGVEALGLYLPLPLVGSIGGRSFLLMQVGANLGYRWLATDAGSNADGHVVASTALGSLNTQITMTDRWAVRGLFEATYTAVAGSIANELAYEHAVALGGSLGVYADISARAPTRYVPRTDPATGVVTYTKELNEGKRLRVMVIAIDGELRLLDTITNVPDIVSVKTGLEYAY